MRFSKTAVWALGLLLILVILCVDRFVFFLRADVIEADVIAAHGRNGRRRVERAVYDIGYEYKGNFYTASVNHFSEGKSRGKIDILVNPGDPTEVCENSFGALWMYKLIFFGIAFVPWSAAALSFIGKNERLVISRKKIGLEKVVRDDDY